PYQPNQPTDRSLGLDVLEEPLELGLVDRSKTLGYRKLLGLVYRSEPFRHRKLCRCVGRMHWSCNYLGGIEEPLACSGHDWSSGRGLLLDVVSHRIRTERSKPLPERVH